MVILSNFFFLHYFTRALLHAEKLLGGVGWGGGGGPCNYCVSPVQRIGFLGFLD